MALHETAALISTTLSRTVGLKSRFRGLLPVRATSTKVVTGIVGHIDNAAYGKCQ
jgi:hypothetical protein